MNTLNIFFKQLLKQVSKTTVVITGRQSRLLQVYIGVLNSVMRVSSPGIELETSILSTKDNIRRSNFMQMLNINVGEFDSSK